MRLLRYRDSRIQKPKEKKNDLSNKLRHNLLQFFVQVK